MVGIRILAVLSVAAVLAAGCARSSPPRETASAAPQSAAPQYVAGTCESALGEAIAPGLMTARSYAMANLALRTEETRYQLLARGVRRFQVLRYAVRCKPYSVIYSAGRMYRCATSARVCSRA